MHRILIFGLLGLFFLRGYAQDTDVLLNHDLYHYIDRIDIRGYNEEVIHTDVKPYGRDYLSGVLKKSYVSEMDFWEQEWHKRVQLLVDDHATSDTAAEGIFKLFYRNHRDFYSLRSKNFDLFINPSASFGMGIERHNYDPAGPENQNISTNSRGLVVRGSLFKLFGFYTEVYDNIIRFPQFIINRYRDAGNTLYGETFVKNFKSTPNALDFFHGRAYMTFSPIPEVMRIKFGHDRAFWGNGFQSLALSDYAANYLMLNINTRIWKFEYTNHFTQMIDFIPNKPDAAGTYPRKYSVFHQLSFLPSPTFSIGVFESIVYTPSLANGQRGLELQYLNPIIFYRSIEQSLGSPDNSFLGLTSKLNLFKHLQVYGQLLIDDFNFAKYKEGNGYWGNKVAYQLGAKYIDLFGVSTLDAQIEYNQLRPYVYQHFNTSSNYTQYGQYLGHASGANLKDLSIILRYHPRPEWNFYLRYSYLKKGLDENGINYGGDISRSDKLDRPGDFGNSTAQGAPLKVSTFYGRLTYQLFKTDIYAEIEGRYRRENGINSYQFYGGIRANLPQRETKF